MLVERFLLNRRNGGLSAGERRILENAVSGTIDFPARAKVVRDGDAMTVSMLLVNGFLSRYVDDREGVRQLVAAHIPGDFVDLHAYPLKVMDHDVGALTDVRLAVVPHERLDAIMRECPELARKLWFSTLVDAAMHRAWVFRLGRLNSFARVANFLCETNARMFAVGLSDGRRFALPLKQFDLGDICGLTSVHVNRVLRELRERGLCTFRSGQVTIHDIGGLTRLGEFDPGYLHLDEGLLGRLL